MSFRRAWQRFEQLKFIYNEETHLYTLDMDWVIEQLTRYFGYHESWLNQLPEPLVLTEDDVYDFESGVEDTPYHQYIKQLKRILSLLMYRRHDQVEFNEAELKSVSNSVIKHRTVLNHRNPFADVAIENQQYMHPGVKGYHVLGFQTGYSVSMTDDEQTVVQMVPSFNVYRAKRPINVKDVHFDETLVEDLVQNETTVFL